MQARPALFWQLARAGDSLVGTAFAVPDSGGLLMPVGPAIGLRQPDCGVPAP